MSSVLYKLAGLENRLHGCAKVERLAVLCRWRVPELCAVTDGSGIACAW